MLNPLYMTNTERRAVWVLSSIYSLRMLGLFMILPVFSIYATQLNGVSPLGIGVALGIYGLTQALFQVPFGYISDRLGRRFPIILGLLLLCLGSVVAALSSSMLGVILGRGIQGMGATGGVMMALLADETRVEVRLRAMACIGIAMGLSFALAFILGPLFNAWYGVSGIFWMTALLALMAVGVVVWLPIQAVSFGEAGSTSVGHGIIGSDEKKGLLSLSLDQGLLPLYVGVLILHASLTAVFLKLPGGIAFFQFEEAELWKFYLPVLLASLLLTVLIISGIERKGLHNPSRVLQKAQTFKNLSWMASSVFVLALSEVGMLIFFESFWGLSLSLILFFTAFNILEASLPSLISRQVAEHRKGTALGIFSALQFFGLFLGGVLGGLLDSWGGLVAVHLFCVILALIWFFWIVLTRRKRLNNSLDSEQYLNDSTAIE